MVRGRIAVSLPVESLSARLQLKSRLTLGPARCDSFFCMTDAFPHSRPISPGSRLAIVAPAGPFDPEAFEAGIEWLRTRYEVRFDESIYTRTGYHAGDDSRRLGELQAALQDPAIDAILCARGGYGVTRLLPGLSPEAVAATGKPLVGFSDITALHALWARAGLRSFHAEMVTGLGIASDAERIAWAAALEGDAESIHWPVDTIVPGAARGRLTGGNLAVLVSLVGTSQEPPLDGTILFLEDVGERPYRIDRMLTQLTQAGWFARCSGIALGAFTEGDPGPDGVSIEQVFEACFGSLEIPVISGLPAGHIEGNKTLPFGAEAAISGNFLTISN